MRISDWSSDVCSSDLFAEKDAITSLDVERCDLAIFALGACASSDDFAFRGLFLGAVRDDDPASSLLFRLYTANENAIMQRTKTHMLTFLSNFPAGGAAGVPVKDAPSNRSFLERSEERRVGKECVSTCRSRW